MVKTLSIFIFLFYSCQIQSTEKHTQASSGKSISMEEKELELQLHATSIEGMRNSYELEISLVNISEKELIVNKRLSMGYLEDHNRELYVEIINPQERENTGIKTRLYERHPPTYEDFGTLKAGDFIHTTFNLFDWWELPKGKFQVKVYYHGTSNPYVQYPDLIIKDTIESNWLEIEMD